MIRCRLSLLLIALFVAVALLPVAAQGEVLTVYSGRGESLVGPLIEQFTAETGIEVQVLYGGTAELAAQILEEGDNSPADVYFAQDGGALGALAKAEVLAKLPSDIMERVSNPAFKSPEDLWVGTSGRARVFVYNPQLLEERGLELPESILDLAQEEWRGVVGWAPTNGSFQANVTAMRVLLGEDTTASWLEGMVANDAQVFPSNTPIVQATIDGEIVGGLVNHYYLFRFLAEDPNIDTAALHFFPDGDAGSLVNVAGAAILESSDNKGLAQRFILFLLSELGQEYFATETFEYPLIDGVAPSVNVKPLDEIEAPDIDLTDIDDLQGTLELIEFSGALAE